MTGVRKSMEIVTEFIHTSYNFPIPEMRPTGNCRRTSWPRTSLGQLSTNIKFVSRVWCDPLILG